KPCSSEALGKALTAGLEHFTALLAEVGLRSGYLEKSDPLMAEIFAWHAAEEIDHKSAAFDLLKETDESYVLRIAGILLAAVLFTGFTTFGIVSFLSQDKLLLDERTFRDIGDFFFGKTAMAGNSFRIFLEYFDPSFHPSQKDIDSLAQEVFKELNEKYPKPLSLVVN
ncbi:MAG TPA: metal-dependent hydrolase, partial [Leptospiraceae bacterium]|nr:metal-dependent hydrolase [Leptospiraceae bacterium]